MGRTVRGKRNSFARRQKYGIGFKQLMQYTTSPITWTAKKIYENPMGASAIVGAGALGAMAPASPILYYGLPAAQYLVRNYMPVRSTRLTRGIDKGTSLFMNTMGLASGGGGLWSIPGYLLRGASGIYNASQLYNTLKKQKM